MENHNLLGADDLFRLGVEVVLDYLEREKIEVLAINPHREKDPQIIAHFHGSEAFITIRATSYPQHGFIDHDKHLQLISLASESGALPYFANVQILTTPGEAPEGNCYRIKGTRYFARFDGLDMMLTSTNVFAAEFPEDTNTEKLEACRAYARAINNLDLSILADWLDDDFKAESQLTFNDPLGKKEYLAYMEKKVSGFKENPNFSINAEIAYTAAFGSGPCVILTQYTPEISVFTYLIDMKGDKIIRSCMCVIPSTEQCRRTGEFPR